MRNTALCYRIVNGKAVIDEKEAIIVRELYRNLNFPPLFYKHGRIDKNYL